MGAYPNKKPIGMKTLMMMTVGSLLLFLFLVSYLRTCRVHVFLFSLSPSL